MERINFIERNRALKIKLVNTVHKMNQVVKNELIIIIILWQFETVIYEIVVAINDKVSQFKLMKKIATHQNFQVTQALHVYTMIHR